MSARSLNRVLLIGNLTRDPELRYTPQGTAVCTFGLATNRSWTPNEGGEQREETEFHRIVSWSKLAEICSQLLYKGRKVFVEGRLQTRTWQGNDGQERTTTEIVIDNMIALGAPKGGREDEMTGEYGGGGYQAVAPVQAPSNYQASDDTSQPQNYTQEPEEEVVQEAAAEEEIPASDKKAGGKKKAGKKDKSESEDDVADDIPF